MNGGDALVALRGVVAALERLGVRNYLGGSWASSAYGVTDLLEKAITEARR
jgi:hypothetical protein